MRLFFIPLLLFPFIGQCQLNDDFSDGDFSQNPIWNGDQNRFQINSVFQLQLHDLEAGNAYLSSPYHLTDSLEWFFSIRLAFSPSGSNNARIYLMSEISDLSENPNGYFLQFGEALSGDAIELFRQEGNEIESICRGSDGKIASAFDVDIKVTYSLTAKWSVYVDWEKNGNFVPECSGQSLSTIANPYFGFYCLYTKSNATKFYFDNVSVDYIFVDTEAPKAEKIEVIGTDQLQIQFNEALEKQSAETLENYSIEQNAQTPFEAKQNESNPSIVLLTFESDIPPNQNLDLILNGIKDLNNNVLMDGKFPFSYSYAFIYDIVFNEIMADPSPVVGLPEVEFLEIYNRTDYPLDLTNWILKIGDEEKVFGDYTLGSNEYLILCNSTKVDSLKSFGSVLSFSSFSLNNDEQKLSLINEFGELIDEIYYSNDWYQNTEKENGGWSLEKINPENICLGDQNWKASTSILGGTPGTVNSVYSDTLILPEILNVKMLNDSLIAISFNQKMQEEALRDIQNYSVNQGIGNPKSITVADDFQSAELVFESHFALGFNYNLALSTDLKNCMGESISGTLNFSLALSKTAEFADIVFNEIMADPSPVVGLPESEYLEIYNQTEYPIDLTNWILKIGDEEKVFGDYTLGSNEYLILCPSTKVDSLKSFGSVLSFSSFSLNNDEQKLSLINEFGELIDEVFYSNNWYQNAEKENGGWSLEKINPGNICLGDQNWKASTSILGGTPGAINSVYSNTLILPKVSSVVLKNDSVIAITFNQKMQEEALLNLQNYSVDQGIGNPKSITISEDFQSVELIFEHRFALGTAYQLYLNTGLVNCLGEAITGTLDFDLELSKTAEFADIVFNEIMADPSPVIGLPEVEFLEIYNQTNYPINLSAWKLLIGDEEKVFGDYTLGSNEYLILCPSTKADSLKSFGSVLSFSSFSLNNDEQNLSLINAFGELIDEIYYSNNWYQNAEKENGGWSLEKINPENICLGDQNWKASTSILGGTPGAINSVYSNTFILPKVSSVVLKNDSVIAIAFNQKMQEEALRDLQNYSVNNAIGNPKGISIAEDFQSAELVFEHHFALGIEYQLSLNINLKNCIGESISGSLDFNIELAKIAEFADIVFNEIMADPSPIVGLPEVEFLEIYNRTDYPIDLANWKLKIGDEQKAFANYTLGSNEYLILCNSTKVDSLKSFGSVLSFSSFSLNNDEQNLSLINEYGELIDEVSYSNNWYQNAEKENGGWSLEKINPDNICLKSENWKASINILGGTPGAINSVYSDTLILPGILNIKMLNDSLIAITFNQKIQEEALLDLQNYSVNNTIGNPKGISIAEDFQSAELVFESHFVLGFNYNLTLSTDLKNCTGESISGTLNFSLALSKIAEYGDIVFNEIMADPSPIVGLPEVEFLEIYNRTDYPIDLANWILKIGDEEKVFGDYTLGSNEYLILCNFTKVDSLKRFGSVLGFSSFSLNNDEQSLSLINAFGELIDEVFYSNNWYQNTEKENGGWSLEKINPDNICLKSENWKASTSILGGTPGAINSVYSDTLILPKANSVVLKNDSVIAIAFNQKMQEETLRDIQNYSVNQGIGNPRSVEISDGFQSVELIFEHHFALGINYNLTLSSDLKNCMGESISGVLDFDLELSKTVEFADIVFNEIMADPSPIVGLPEVEFLEIYNRTDYPIVLANWILKIGDEEKVFGNYTLDSNEYLILCPSTKVDSLKSFGSVLSFSSFSLNNDEQKLSLINEFGELIDEIYYSNDWYQNTEKENGGWSLEKINPENICLGDQNWKASTSILGGTPGAINSVYSNTLILPKVSSVVLKNDSLIAIAFNQKMQEVVLRDIQNYFVNQEVGNPRSVEISDGFQSVELIFEHHFALGFNYNLTLSTDLKNCMGESISGALDFDLELSKTAEFADIVFNEIMADPSPVVGLPESEYLEIYNRTDCPIDLANWILKIGDEEKAFGDYTLGSKEYLILCNSTKVDSLKSFGSVWSFSSFSLNNDEQNLSLINEYGELIDEVSYSNNWYQNTEKENGGWSLEKINPDNICLENQNWKASTSILGGTPGAINSIYSDTLILPKVSSVDLKNDSVIAIAFNQKMQEEALYNLQNYSVDQGIGSPRSVEISDGFQSVELIFEHHFALGFNYNLTLSTDLKNCMGESISGVLDFDLELSKTAEFADIVFNEIMADPSPVVGLSESEYLEIYNQTEYPIDLANWLLKIGDEEKAFGDYTLDSNEYLILCPSTKVDSLKSFGSVLSFSSFSLNNDEQKLSLINEFGELIDEVFYSNNWYQNAEKENGGWSLEKINPGNICLGDQNWKASTSILGGTPGAINSVYSDTLILPEILNVKMLNDSLIAITFNQKMQEEALYNLQNYSLDQGIGSPKSIAIAEDFQSLELIFEHHFALGFNYNLTLSTDLKNCMGESISGVLDFDLELSKTAEFADIVFNEIMADPSPVVGLPESEYLEIYNRTEYPIDLSNWKLLIGDEEKSFSGYTLKSNEYLILCNSTKIDYLKSFGSVLSFSSFSLNNDEQNLSLINAFGELIDEIYYSNNWYQNAEKENGGWSLEKINPDNICLESENWKASTSILGGTPGAINSVYSNTLILPKVSSVVLKNDSVIAITFNQKMQEEALLDIQNYSVNQEVGNPRSVEISDGFQSVELIFEHHFALGTAYQLSLNTSLVNCLRDAITGTLDFDLELSKTAEFADIVFNEIMADPSPVIGLPEVEFLEIYNRTDYPIDLANWILKIGDEQKAFADYTLGSNEYLILCPSTKVDSLKSFGSVLSFSSFSLNNDEQSLSLINEYGELIDEVFYSNNWYQNTEKENGGWSLEKINSENICLGDQNWKASINILGGTPGAINSVYSDTLILPKVSSVDLKNDSVIAITFNQKMQEEVLRNIQNFFVNQGIGNPKSITVADDFQSAELIFESHFVLGIEYNLTLSTDLKNCMGESISGVLDFDLELSKTAEFADIVFNEIMADPSPVIGLPEVEFLEIYNRTNYPINLSAWKLLIGDEEKVFGDYTLGSNEYLILCHSTKVDSLKRFGSVLSFSSFSLNNDEQSLSLINAFGELIDEVSYSNNWYQNAEKENGGWSLEKINPDNICLESENWKASIDIIGGTPGAINSIYSDTLILPKVSSVDLKNDSVIAIVFNQKMQEETLLDLQNYFVDQEIGNPKSIAAADDFQSAELIFESHFVLGINYNLTLSSNLKNCMGESISGTLNFSLALSKSAEYGDILINEIMANPTPSQGLPEAEYIELFNQTNYPINLIDWILVFGNSKFQFSDITLNAKSYIILTHPNNAILFRLFGNVLKIPSFNLSNSEDKIVLKNQLGHVIHFIHYQDNWYRDDFKSEGGWSLEMISQDYFCEQAENWTASENANGGTPGLENSVINRSADYLLPDIKWISIEDQNTLSLHFSKSMDTIPLKNTANYTVDNALGSPSEVQLFSPDYSVSQLRFTKSFNENTHYELNLNRSISGCNGFELTNYSKLFALPQDVEAGDLVINEILFDAWQNDGDYVELFNRSNKVIDSRKLLFSRLVTELYDTTFYSFQPNMGLVFPNEYFVFCKNKSAVLDVYYSENPAKIYEFDDFPLLPNSSGSVLLSKASQKNYIIDALKYAESMHHSLINNTKGKALERLSPDKETNDANNWLSAAASVNFGTPAYKNSQFQDVSENEEIIQISPEIFTPDSDGIDDLLKIDYAFSESGFTLNLIIYNSQKQEINHLIKNEIMSPQGQIFWDGCTENGDKAPIGIYILYFEYFDLSGRVEKIKKTCVLGGKL